MKEKIFEWAEMWGIKVENISETKNLIWFEIDTTITKLHLKDLENATNLEFASIDWCADYKLQIWLSKNKGE